MHKNEQKTKPLRIAPSTPLVVSIVFPLLFVLVLPDVKPEDSVRVPNARD